MRTPKSTDVPNAAGLPAEDKPGMAAAAGVTEVRTGGGPGRDVGAAGAVAPGGGPGPAVASGQALSPSEMASAVQHTEAVKSRALAVLVATGTHDEHVQALLELRAAVAGLHDLVGAGRLLPAGTSAPTRHRAVTDDRALLAAAAAALAYMEDN